MECEFPRINSNEDEVKKYLEDTKTIAVVGASPNPKKDSHKVTKYLIEQGYKVFPIYPRGEEILGQKAYRSLKDIKESVDMVVVFRNLKLYLQ